MGMKRLLISVALAIPATLAINMCVQADKLDHMPAKGEVLPGRQKPMPLEKNAITGAAMDLQPSGMGVAYFSMGCFWGAEEHFFHLPGVVSTAVGYGGGATPNPTYEEVSSGRTGAAETVRVVYDPSKISFDELLAVFWEQHDPTEGFRQGNDVGTQYRSAIFTTSDAQTKTALASREKYQGALKSAKKGDITTEIRQDATFYYAEGYHQQYCYKNPEGYCGHGGLGVPFPR
jgi:peptide-methionine (S)-S-oxide reductase